MKIMNKESGAVLVLVLAVLLIIAIGIACLVGRARSSMILAGRAKDQAESDMLVQTGFSLALERIQQRRASMHFSATDIFMFQTVSGELISKDVTLADSAYTDTWNSVHVMDEQSKINLNTAGKEELLRVPGVTNQIADCIIDWRDADDRASGAGAESDYYRTLPVPYESKNAYFESLEELLLLPEMTASTYQLIGEYLTVYGDGSVNINSCSAEALCILGLDESLSRRIIALRAGADGGQGTSDDLVFESVDQVLNQLQNRLVLEDFQRNMLFQLLSQSRLSVSSEFYKVVVSSTSDNGQLNTLTAVVQARAEGNPAVCFWSEW